MLGTAAPQSVPGVSGPREPRWALQPPQHCLPPPPPRCGVYVFFLHRVHRLQILQQVLDAAVTQSFWRGGGGVSFGSVHRP